jgi:hypothetical protein
MKGKAFISATIEADIDVLDLNNYDLDALIKEALTTNNVAFAVAQIADENGSIIAIERQ